MNLIPEGLKENQIICLMKHGSHLYGTDGPDSDTDYKGVYMPTRRQLLLQQVPKSYSIHPDKTGEGQKNSKDDLDVEIYSLHYFLKLAMEGQTVAIDMLHADLGWCKIAHPIWAELLYHRKKFHTKNLKAFVGYARKQAAKYGIKGSRLNDAKSVMDFLEHAQKHECIWGTTRLSHVWNGLPEGEHIHKFEPVFTEGKKPIGTYQVCGKQIQSTVTVSYAYDIIKKFYDEYGARAKAAARNKGVDWKAVSHALRAAYQVDSILTKGDITFPLGCAAWLKMVKYGDCEWKAVQNTLESKIAEVERLAEGSSLPNKVDRKFWENWLVKTLERIDR
jgi:hypothetical protein